MNRALAVLAAAAVLVVAVEATGPARTAIAVPLAALFAVLSVLGFRWAQRRGPRSAAAYFAGLLVLGYVVFDAAAAGVGALREPWESVTAALGALTAESAGVTASLEVRGTPRALPADAERALYRAAQEALTNVRKHAGVDRARVLLGYSGLLES